MISVNEADQLLDKHRLNLGSETIPLRQAYGRILAQEVMSDREYPSFHRVAMDGIAINYEDWMQGLRDYVLIGTQKAGESPMTLSKKGTCVKVMTGAVCPPGANSIIPVESVRWNDAIATVETDEVNSWQHLHQKGSDYSKSM